MWINCKEAEMVADTQREALGPAEKIINALTAHLDHAVHNRPGLVTKDGRTAIGMTWQQATWKKEGDQKVVYTTRKVGKSIHKTRVGVWPNGSDEVREAGQLVGYFRNPGLFPEVVAHIYSQIAEVWSLDNEFAAKWASWAFVNEDNRDLKVILAAFLLVQSRFGEQIQDGDEKFLDEDYRAVGEAMCLLRSKKKGATFNPKLLLRVGEVLELPQVVEINRKLGFGQTGRRAVVGRYRKVIEKWLRHVDMNSKLLEKLVKESGFRTKVMALARKVGYKPLTDRFFEILRWKQVQAKDGRRTVAIGQEVTKADTWEGLGEADICPKIIMEKPSWKVIAGKLPGDVGVTPAIMCAAIEAGSLSDQDLIIMTPTLEELGLLTNVTVEKRWQEAMDKAENQRAANIARNVKTQKAKEGLEEAADKAVAKAVAEVAREMRIYVIVDASGSMQQALVKAKEYMEKFVGSFPLDRLHVCVFNTVGREVTIKSPTAAAVRQAFRGYNAGGGTDYAAGAYCLLDQYKTSEDEDALLIFIGDQADSRGAPRLDRAIQESGVNVVAFGMLHIKGLYGDGTVVVDTAARLEIPCFNIEEGIFADPYAVPRTLRNLIAATPVGKRTGPTPSRRVSVIDSILKTPLLEKPAWA
jgi:Mg-chelatase subunit ChlD